MEKASSIQPERNLGGRPTKWTPEVNEQIVEFFSGDRFREVEIVTTGKNDYSKIETKLVAEELPTFERFGHSIDVDSATFVNWANADRAAIKANTESNYPGFFAAYTHAKQLQKDFIMQNGLMGLYNGQFAIFIAKNVTDLKDKQELELGGEIGIKGYAVVPQKASGEVANEGHNLES